jgi:hypothetical protein
MLNIKTVPCNSYGTTEVSIAVSSIVREVRESSGTYYRLSTMLEVLY